MHTAGVTYIRPDVEKGEDEDVHKEEPKDGYCHCKCFLKYENPIYFIQKWNPISWFT